MHIKILEIAKAPNARSQIEINLIITLSFLHVPRVHVTRLAGSLSGCSLQRLVTSGNSPTSFPLYVVEQDKADRAILVEA